MKSTVECSLHSQTLQRDRTWTRVMTATCRSMT